MNKSDIDKLACYVDSLVHDFNSTPEMVSVGLNLLNMFPDIKGKVLEYKSVTDVINLQKCIVGCIKDSSVSLTLSTELDKQIFKICTRNSSDFYDIVSDYIETVNVDPVVLSETMIQSGHLSIMAMKEIVASEDWIECCKWVVGDEGLVYDFISGGLIGSQG